MHVIGKDFINDSLLLRILQSGEEKHVTLKALTEQNEDLKKIITQLEEKLPLPASINGRKMNGWAALFERAIERARKGFDIQRYKGLGEMNPEQLWETTMDPEKRTLVQVSVEDFAHSDHIFSVLMGDVVQSRRKFIQDNALSVKNLDI